MGQVSEKKLVAVIILFSLVATLVYFRSDQGPYLKRPSLSQSLSTLERWETTEKVELDQKIIDSLELDDYLNQSYTNGVEAVSLYIGYYMSSKKVGAAHSPLVCFPGQGWVISDRTKSSLQIDGKIINFATMVASKGQKKELVIYWFQAVDKTSAGTFLQKVNLILAKFFQSRQDTAFVRITTPVGDKPMQHYEEIIRSFIRDFYPVFCKYVQRNLY